MARGLLDSVDPVKGWRHGRFYGTGFSVIILKCCGKKRNLKGEIERCIQYFSLQIFSLADFPYAKVELYSGD